MIALLHFATLLIATMFAAAAAAAFHWLLLRGAFLMMQPATVRRVPNHTELAQGTAQLARAFAARH